MTDNMIFSKASPVWFPGREREMNLFTGCRAEIYCQDAGPAVLRVTCASLYRAYVNGRFVAHGPARGPHGFFRVDEIPIALEAGTNFVAIEVAAYHVISIIDEIAFYYGGGGWFGAQGVWTKTGGSFHRLGRDNDNKNEGSGSNAMVYKDYYKGFLNMGDHVTGINEGDYLFKGREFEPFLAQGNHYYLANADHQISCEVEEGYHFTSWTGDATYNTQTANMNFSVSLESAGAKK